MSKLYFSLNQSIRFNPWIYFLIFLSSNLLLSYYTLSVEITLWIGIFGLIFPFLFGLWTYKPAQKPEIPLYQLEFFKKIPTWIWLIIGALALFFRFYKL